MIKFEVVLRLIGSDKVMSITANTYADAESKAYNWLDKNCPSGYIKSITFKGSAE